MTRCPSLRVSVAREDPAWRELLPGAARLLSGAARRAFRAAWGHGWRGSTVGHECNLLLTGDSAMRALNRHWRGRDHATNVLAFAALDAGLPPGNLPWLLGDVVLASGVIGREARRQRKSFADHALHMAVHGVLHLLGYDHQTRAGALAMERLEIAALGHLGIANPYR